MGCFRPFVIFSLFASFVSGVPLSNLYPHGTEVQDSVLDITQDVPEIMLKVPIKFFDELYSSVYVNQFGCLTFRAPILEFISMPFPLDFPAIAALYSNINIKNAGRIFHRESEDPELLQRADADVARYFPRLTSPFKSKSVFISTWSEVGYNMPNPDKVNTFQIVVITDGEESFVEILYADNGIQLLQGNSTDPSGFPDAKGQAGLMQDGILYTLPTSGTDQARHLDILSNTETPGLWIFRVGNLANIGAVEAPEATTLISKDATCATAAIKCHSQAECTDDTAGFCCVCRQGYYGNGLNCFPEGVAIRVNGKLSVDVNGIKVDNVDLQSYVSTSDGRHYTVLTRLPPIIGNSLQLANLAANGVGWMFAKSVSAPNGFQISGGVFNYTADLSFSTGQRLSVREEFTGNDVYDQLQVQGSISGSVPQVAMGVKAQLEDTQQEFTHSSAGLFQSQASHTYQLPGNNPPQITVRVIQTIQYNEGCDSQMKNISNARMKLNKNMIVYEARENILRVAATTKITSLNLNEDLCKNFFCIANSSCVVEDDKPTCICNRGFQQLYSEDRRQEDFGCFDVNECKEGRHTCHQNAICFNEIGSYSCQCRPGFIGNGYQCTENTAPQTPSVSPCESDPESCNPPHSTCTDPADYRTCNCDPGFQKDYLDEKRVGFRCIDSNECLNYPPVCNNNAECINQPGSYVCQCRPGYTGDGVFCEQVSSDPSSGPIARPSDPSSATCDQVRCQEYAECIEDPTSGPYCNCISGYASNGKNCVPLDKMSCEFANDCGPNAQCILNEAILYHYCVCDEGFKGDGYICTRVESGQNDETTAQKTCILGTCECPKGYVEQGSLCIKEESDVPPSPTTIGGVSCNTKTSCHPNAQCVYMPHARQYLCQCNAGYDGDGAQCVSVEESCFVHDICHTAASCQYDDATGRGVCMCEQGYTGNGISRCDLILPSYSLIPCSKRDEPSERTKEDGTKEQFYESTQCGHNAYCAENTESKSFECICIDGFYQDGETCRAVDKTEDSQEDGEECETTCHSNAQCTQDSNNESKCVCNVGYVGDGVNECNAESLGCNIMRNCHTNAECLYNATSAGYTCQCVQGYVGNGLECHPDKTCLEDKSLCAKDASCVVASQGHFHCECNEGFTGNGFTCKPVHKKESDFLLVNQGMGMIRVPYQPSRTDQGRLIHIHPNQLLIGIAVDCVEGLVYYSSVAGKSSIKRSYFDGKNVEDVVTKDIVSPEGLTIDWINRVLYWTDSKLDTISMAALGDPQPSVIVSKNLVNPRGIAVHPHYRKLFWSDWNRSGPKIEWSNLDGTDREVFLRSSDLKSPNSLAVDFTTDELCWVDADAKSLECMSIHSRERRIVYSNCSYPFGLTITDDKYYWTDWKTNRIESATKNGERSSSISLTLLGTSNMYGIASVPSRCPGS